MEGSKRRGELVVSGSQHLLTKKSPASSLAPAVAAETPQAAFPAWPWRRTILAEARAHHVLPAIAALLYFFKHKYATVFARTVG